MGEAQKVDEKAKLVEMLKTFRTAMLVSDETGSGVPHGRPMAIAQVEDNCDIWFLSGKASGKVAEVKADNRGLVLCQSGSAFVSVSGELEVTRDPKKVDELWDDSYESWFPKGKEDPNLVLIHLRAHEGEWWDERGVNRVKYAFEVAKAFATGTKPEIDKSQHGRVS